MLGSVSYDSKKNVTVHTGPRGPHHHPSLHRLGEGQNFTGGNDARYYFATATLYWPAQPGDPRD